ncbi:hypothetical protein DEU56DRAFT_830470 [Suillus clintonianus]|uniref:uncharacterized protein n=1 Tax=Suillus clintonianus TaxID=1904413 RepID=UPI001B86DAD5|nr:uncharacterized protein DEU56DRAFT_830470 [Suillus clintonianus]KAG2123238.1 hypothetical protein DEU56DRAFT_830470 [Suillus clintonianus]
MVHRPPDSRLLSNLIAHEKEYTKHLSALFPISHAALASLSAFAVASPSAIPSSSVSLAQTIGTIVDILAGVDDALQLYNQAVENWRDQLGHLIKLEEDIAAILRDREILVTRLIKVSKSSKATRDPRSSLILPSGSTSFTSLPSTNSTAHSSSNTKLLQAQEELRACEAHLAAKELELEGLRVSIAREGLGARCRAIIDCGWAWGELGKEGLRALQSLNVSSSNGQVTESPSASFSSHSPSASITLPQQKPLPSPALPLHVTQGPISYSSDISSLTPSQSASQQHDGPSRGTSQEGVVPDRLSLNGHQEVTITIPPAHAISELTMPTGVRSPSPLSNPLPERSTDLEARPIPRSSSTQQIRHQLSRRITEVDENEYRERPAAVANSYFDPTRDADDSSEEEETQGPLEVVENNPFEPPKRFSLRHEVAPDTVERIPERSGKQRERKPSMSFFGSLRGLFKTSHKDQTRAEWDDAAESPRAGTSNEGKKGKKGWSTRTDANLKASRSQDSLESEPNKVLKPPLPSGGAKLRKGRSQMTALASSSGWQSDGPPSASPRTSVRRKKKSVAELKGKDGGYTDGELDTNESAPSGLLSRSQSEVVTRRPSAKRQKTPTSSPQAQPLNLSRASSLSTRNGVVSSPNQAVAKSQHRRASTDLSGNLNNGNGEATYPRRSASITYGAVPQYPGDSSAAARSKSKRTPKAGTIHPLPPKGSTSVSLMSIVEDVARQNRNDRGATPLPLASPHALGSSPSTAKLEIPRAPIPGVPVNATWSSKLSDDRLPVRSGSLDLPHAPGSVFSTSQSLSAVSGAQRSVGSKYEIPLRRPSVKQGSGSASASGSEPRKSSRPAVSPLRSALRNSSRTPSPSPAQLAEIRQRGADVRTEEDDKPRGRTPEREESEERSPRPARPGQASESNDVSIRDSVSMTSISSYRTAQESPVERESAPQAPPAPQHDIESSTTSNETLPTRRKSVRVSLHPTFSTTPPALDDDEASGRYPWSSTKKDCDNGDGSSEPVVWQDSSDEDEEYSRARKLLSRVGKKDKEKKKNV